MSDGDSYLLKTILKQEKTKNFPALSEDRFFEYFTAEQILKHSGYDLDPDQITAGIVGGSGDGGVDAIFVFANRMPIGPDTDLSVFQGQQIGIELVVIASTRHESYREGAFKNWLDFIENCLQFGVDQAKTAMLYDSAVLDEVARFKALYESALLNKPRLDIKFFYATLSDERVDAKIEVRRQEVEARLQGAFSIATSKVYLVGAKDLLTWYQVPPSRVFKLVTGETHPWKQFGTSYIAFVGLRDFYAFITTNDQLRESLFEANVRDYQGDVAVNMEIRATLAAPAQEEFWWLNNGITILASEVSSHLTTLNVTDPLIVNGLQTSYELAAYFRAHPTATEKRSVLVRVIVTDKPESVDRIIRATNSQTKIPPIWLHSTEPVHRSIEIALKAVGLYYDRRKNYHRNLGKSIAEIVTLPYLAQAIAAIVLQRPDDARARPTTLASKNYKALFPSKGSTDVFVKSALLMKQVDTFLDAKDIDRATKRNLMFYVAMVAACSATRSAAPKRAAIANIDPSKLTDELFESSYRVVNGAYGKLVTEGEPGDKVAKGPQLAERLKTNLQRRFGRTTVRT
jgi:hypothetical protein